MVAAADWAGGTVQTVAMPRGRRSHTSRSSAAKVGRSVAGAAAATAVVWPAAVPVWV